MVFTIPAPVMQDSLQQSSAQIETGLELNGDGSYTLSYAPSLEWLREEGRAYPVAVDPVITTQPQDGIGGPMEDTFTDSAEPTQNNYSSELLTLGSYQEATKDIYCIPSGIMFLTLKKNITKASIKFHQAGYFRFDKDALAGLYQVSSNCTMDQLTYQNRPQTEQQPIDYAKIREDVLEFDLTGYIHNCFEGRTQYPLAIKVLKGTGLAWYDSNEAVDAANAPVQELEYTYPTGANTRYDSHTWDMGKAGLVKWNDFTGFLSITREEIGIPDGKMPVSIQRIYNTANASISMESTLNKMLSQSQYGGYWTTNYDRRLVYLSSVEDIPTVSFSQQYAYGDGDGSWYYFTDTGKRENGYILWESISSPVDSGKRFTLYVPEGQKEPAEYQSVFLREEGGYLIGFDKAGHVVSITDPEDSSSIRIAYNEFSSPSDSRIQNITDGEGRVYRFTYNSDNLLSSISCSGSGGVQQVSYTYLKTGLIIPYYFLSSTRLPDGATVTYSNSTVLGDVFSFITNISDGRTGDSMTIKNLPTYQTSSVQVNRRSGESIHLDRDAYGPYQAVFYDYATDHSLLKKFNSLGETVMVYEVWEDGGKLLYQRYSDGTVYEQVDASNLLENPGFENAAENWETNGLAIVSGDQAHSGKSSMMLVNAAGLANAALTPFHRYRLSAFIKTPAGATDIGASLTIVCLNNDLEVIDTKTGPLVANTNGEWQELALDYDVPNGALGIYVSLNTTGSGVLYADDFSLQALGSGALGDNLIQNPYFSADPASGSNWTYEGGGTMEWTELAENGELTPLPILDPHVALVSGSPGAPSRIKQTVTINGSAGERFAFGAWAAGYPAAPGEGRAFAMRVEAPAADGAGTEVLGEFQFQPYVTAGLWQYGSDCLTLPRDVSEVTVTLLFDSQVNCVAFDGVSLCRLTD